MTEALRVILEQHHAPVLCLPTAQAVHIAVGMLQEHGCRAARLGREASEVSLDRGAPVDTPARLFQAEQSHTLVRRESIRDNVPG